MENISRRDLVGMATIGAGAMAFANVAFADEPADDENTRDQTVRTVGHVPDLTMRDDRTPDVEDKWLAKLLDEPEVEGDLTLPNGEVVPAIYLKLRNRLNRMGHGCGSEVVETS